MVYAIIFLWSGIEDRHADFLLKNLKHPLAGLNSADIGALECIHERISYYYPGTSQLPRYIY